MTKYILEDGFEFITDDTGMVIKTRTPSQDYQREDIGIYIIGSISSDKRSDLTDKTIISNPPNVGEHIIVDNERVGPRASPTRIVYIEKSGLLRKIADLISGR